MTPARFLFAFLVALSSLRLYADDKPAAPPPDPTKLTCGVGPDAPPRIEVEKLADTGDLAAAGKSPWRNKNAIPPLWNHLMSGCYQGKEGWVLCKDARVVKAAGGKDVTFKDMEAVVKKAWDKTDMVGDRDRYLSDAQARYVNDTTLYYTMANAYSDAKSGCQPYADAEADGAKADKFSKALADFDANYDKVSKADGNDNAQPDLNAPLNRVAYTYASKGDVLKVTKDRKAAIDTWKSQLAAKKKAADDQAAKVKGQDDAQAAKVAQFQKDKQQFKDGITKGDEKAVAGELQKAFDDAGVSGVHVNAPVKNVDGSVSVNIDVSKDDWDKLGSGPDGDAKKQALLAKLKALGIPDVEIGKDVHQRVRFPTDDQRQSIDSFEKVIFDNKGTLSIKYDSISKTVKDGAADAAVKTALGSSVSGVASDPEKKKELDDKIRKLGNKYNADYVEASADLKKNCEKAYADIKALGGDPGPKKKECADKQGQLDKDHAEKARALGEQQGSADVARAADAGNSLQAYSDKLGEKQANYKSIQDNASTPLMKQRLKAQGIDLSALGGLQTAVQTEKFLIDGAIKKIPEVQAGKNTLASIAAADKGQKTATFSHDGCIQAAMDADSADNLFDKRFGKYDYKPFSKL